MATETGLPAAIRKLSHTPLTYEAEAFKPVRLSRPGLLKRIAAYQWWSMTQASFSAASYRELPRDMYGHASTKEHVLNGRGTRAMLASQANHNICRIGSTLCQGRKLYYATEAVFTCALDGPLCFDWASHCPLCAVKL